MATTHSQPIKTHAKPAALPRRPRTVVWHRSAPPAIAQAGLWDSGTAGWEAWVRHLRRRRHRPDVAELMPRGCGHPLEWIAWPEPAPRTTIALVEGLCRRKSPRERERQAADAELRSWMLESEPRLDPTTHALECLAWCFELPALSRALSAERWWELLDYLVDASAAGHEPQLADHPAARQLLTGELPLALSYLLPELRTPRRLRDGARRELTSGILKWISPEGVWPSQQTPSIWALLASWTRCRAIGARLRRGCWDEPAELRYRQALVQALRLCDRTSCLGAADVSGARGTENFWRAATTSSGMPGLASLVDESLGTKLARRALTRRQAKEQPSSSMHCEPQGFTVLRGQWRRGADRLHVDYSGTWPRIELTSGPQTYFEGDWRVQVSVDGRALSAESGWEPLCWVDDEDVAYLELEADYAGGVRVQRHMLLAREVRLLILADSVLGETGEVVEYCSSLPLARGVTVEAEAETREVRLAGGRRRATVLPLALPEWRAANCRGGLTSGNDELTLEQTCLGESLFAPLVVDLDPRRGKQPLTWRQLTVAHLRQPLPPNVAAGFRAQIGREQWIVYRSLNGRQNRTVLGQNIVTEMYIARFRRDGSADTLLEIA